MDLSIPYDGASPDFSADAPQEISAFRDRRAWWIFIPFLIPTMLCGVSYLSGGVPELTDAGFVALTAICGGYVIREFLVFTRRTGIGGLLLFGGVLVWLCHDYFYNWFGRDFNAGSPFPAAIVAKSAFWHCVFITMMTFGLLINRGRWLERLITAVPEPSSSNVYWLLVVLMFLIGIMPYFVWTQDFGLVSMYKAAFSCWLGESVRWTGGRTGNLNYDWHAYIAQILQVGQMGSILAAMYAIMLTKSVFRRVFCLLVWTFHGFCAFQSGRRGEVAYLMLPLIALFFVKYQAIAAQYLKRGSYRAFIVAGVLAFVFLSVAQIQGSFRGVGLETTDLSKIELGRAQGDSMFSESLLGWALIPDHVPPFYDSKPGEAIIRPIFDKIYWFAIGPIPRVLWNTKPIDPCWAWFNKIATGEEGDGTGGTTVSNGLAGHWYFRYGWAGVLEGGLLMGWLIGISERAFHRAGGRPMGILMSLGFATWLFRVYRDFIFIDLYGLMIGAAVFTLMVWISRPVFGSASSMELAPT